MDENRSQLRFKLPIHLVDLFSTNKSGKASGSDSALLLPSEDESDVAAEAVRATVAAAGQEEQESLADKVKF